MRTEQFMPDFNKEKLYNVAVEQYDKQGIQEGTYDVIDAEILRAQQALLRDAIIKKINDDEYCSEIFTDLHKASFIGFEKEEVAGHIMHRVLVGTNINSNEEREFIFDHIDTEISNLLQEILVASNKQEAHSMIQNFLIKKGQVKITRQFDN